jgi:hypothetical protein
MLISSLGMIAARPTYNWEAVMRTTGLIKVLVVGLAMTMMIGCGSSKSNSNSNSIPPVPQGPVAPTNPGTETPTGQTTWPFTVSGEVVAFSPVSYEELNSYVAIRALNNPSNVKININMKKISGTSFYAGKIQIGYNDNGRFWYGSFSVGEGRNTNCPKCRDNNLYKAAPNFWTRINGVSTFMAYVQDKWGALIIVMEPETAGADGEAGGLLKGRIYYRNFAKDLLPQYDLNPQSPYYRDRECWYIYSRDYACYSNNMSQKLSSTDFSDGTFKLLGSFSGARRDKALGL